MPSWLRWLVAGARPAAGKAPSTNSAAVQACDSTKDWCFQAASAISAAIHIAVIIVVAVIVRYLIHRIITRVVRRTAGGLPVPLTRLRGKARQLLEVTDELPLVNERREQRAKTVGSVLKSIATVFIYGTAFVMVLYELGFNISPVLTSAGIVGVAVGFGAQNLVRDFLSGIFMILEDQYGVGDVVDVGFASGTVEAVGLRTTRVRDVEGTVWHVRNGEIARVGNKSQNWSRAVLDIPVAYTADVDRVTGIIERAGAEVAAHPDFAGMILEEPAVWGIERFDPDSLVVRLVIKTKPLKQWDVARAVRAHLKAAFDEAGLRIPVPQRAIWLQDGSDPSTLLHARNGAGGVPADERPERAVRTSRGREDGDQLRP